jgi:hypothetical protein
MNKIIAILIVVLLFVLAASIGLKIFFQAQDQSSQPYASLMVGKDNNSLPRVVYSGMISMYANGRITKIQDSKITIQSRNDSLTIAYKNDVEVNTAKTSGSKIPSQILTLKDLKVGDIIYTSFRLLSNNTWQGETITLMPPQK